MTELHLPWLELTILAPLLGAALVSRLQDRERARQVCLGFCAIAFVGALGAWQDFLWEVRYLHVTQAHDPWDLVVRLVGQDLLVVDELSAPLLPLAAALYLLTAIATLRTKMRRFSFGATLLSEAIVLATLSCRQPWAVAALLALGTLPPYWELRTRGKPVRVYVLHMSLFVGLLVLGLLLAAWGPGRPEWAAVSLLPLVAAVVIRSGLAPFHCWVTDLFEHATFGTALLFVLPMLGAYAVARLILPVAPDWVLMAVGVIALATAVYSAGMGLVQREARRFFCYLFLSHSALVLVGLDTVTPIGLTGALSLWLSIGLSLAGFGLTLRALEARHGRLSLATFHGVYDHTPELAVCFLLTGMASVGFPGTLGFLATELLVDGAVQAFPYVGIAVVLAAALNGIAVMQVYFRLFTGTRHVSSVPLKIGPRERWPALVIAALILGGGIFPQPGIASRNHAAVGLLKGRTVASQPVAAVGGRQAHLPRTPPAPQGQFPADRRPLHSGDYKAVSFRKPGR